MKELEGNYLMIFKNGYLEKNVQISKLPLVKEREILWLSILYGLANVLENSNNKNSSKGKETRN